MPPTVRRTLTALAIVVLARVWCPNVSALPAPHTQVPFGLRLGAGDDGNEVALGPPLVTASDTACQQDAGCPASATSNRSAEMAALLDKYAPVFKLASSEIFYPSSVSYMLKHYTFVEHKNGTAFHPPPSTLTPSGLPSLPRRGKKQLLSVGVQHNAQPRFENDTESGFLYGPGPVGGGAEGEAGEDGRGTVEEEVYGFWVDHGKGVVDLWYWTFYPYNLGKQVGSLGWLGNHVVDWEHLRVRTVNGTAQSADFDTHSGGKFSAGTYLWNELELHDGRPVAYVAAGSHGVWPVPGKHVYAQLLNLWALVDITDDVGAIWDTKGRVVPIQFWSGPETGAKVNHTDTDLAWLDYRGKWGNRGDKGCWWYPLVGICQMMDGPPGPNRRFGRPMECILGDASETGVSTYDFYLSRNVSAQADLLNITTVVVEQVCARPSVMATPDSDSLDDDELETWITSTRSGSLPYTGAGHYTGAHLDGCDGSRSAAKAYRLALLDDEGERLSTSPLRVVCVYEEGEVGRVSRSAVDVRDVDEWRWWLKRQG